jgi:uncharacterized protein
MALQYHEGQIELQNEANTRPVAEMLAGWVGPVGEFARVADMVLLATQSDDTNLRFSVVSGKAPLIEVTGDSGIRIPDLQLAVPGPEVLAGGLAICLAQRRRARINGRLVKDSEGWTLEAAEAFTNCRKYIAPSVVLEDGTRGGATAVEPLSSGDPWLRELLARAETAFLASVSPGGLPDVSHRGGPPGYLQLDSAAGLLSWPEYVGDGMFKSAGNVRATGQATLLVLDLVTGDAAELIGEAGYRTLRTYKQARTDPLLSGKDPFPVQGDMTLSIRHAYRLHSLVAPRQRLDKTEKLTSCSSTDDQAPQ